MYWGVLATRTYVRKVLLEKTLIEKTIALSNKF